MHFYPLCLRTGTLLQPRLRSRSRFTIISPELETAAPQSAVTFVLWLEVGFMAFRIRLELSLGGGDDRNIFPMSSSTPSWQF